MGNALAIFQSLRAQLPGSFAAAPICPQACTPDARQTTASHRGSQGRSPGPGVQGARSPLAARRVGERHLAQCRPTWLRAGSAPRAPHWGAQRAPRPPASDACRTINPSAHASGIPKWASAAACSNLPISMHAKRSAYSCIESGFQGTQSSAGVTFFRRAFGCGRTPHGACQHHAPWRLIPPHWNTETQHAFRSDRACDPLRPVESETS
jgi:hypothetical protein